jgi:predicted nuclease of predicted toxin-antitoxin system
MKLLLDNNLSVKLISRLRDLYDLSHTSRFNLSNHGDALLWRVASERGYTIVTRDSDFAALVVRYGFPPRVIWLRMGDCSTDQAEQCLRNHFETIREFHSSDKGILQIRSISPL